MVFSIIHIHVDQVWSILPALESLPLDLSHWGSVPWKVVSTSVIKKGIKEWVNDSKELYWRNINYASHTKSFIKELNVNFDAPLICFERSMIRNCLAVITGHGPFKIHLQKLKLAEETDCPKCGQDSDTALHYIISCHFTRRQGSKPICLKGSYYAIMHQCVRLGPIYSYVGAVWPRMLDQKLFL